MDSKGGKMKEKIIREAWLLVGSCIVLFIAVLVLVSKELK